MFFDTHAHYDDKAFDEDRKALLTNLRASGIGLILNPGCDVASSNAAAQIAVKNDFVYFASGLHPEEIEKADGDWLDEIGKLASAKKCRAIGEIGLDYYWDDTHKSEQQEIFVSQLRLASDIGKPVIIHDREAHKDSFDAVCNYPELKGVFHCFSGSAEMAQELLKRGWYLGFDGPITYKNARKALEVLEICPLDRMLIETDSPYLSPVPMRGKRNDSSNLRFICEKISEIKKISAEEVEQITFENGKNLFSI